MVVTPDEKYAITTNNGTKAHSLTVIEIASWSVTQTLSVPKAWLGMRLAKDGTRLYISGGNDNRILVYAFDLGRLSLIDSIALGAPRPQQVLWTGGLDLAESSGRIYVVGKESDSVYAVNLKTHLVEQRASLPARPYTCLLSRTGEVLYVTLWGGSALERHREMAPDAVTREAIEEILGGLESHRRGLVLLAEAPSGVRARFVAAGELLASRLTVACLAAAGIEAAWFDAREVVRTEGIDPEKDPPVPGEIAPRAQASIRPLLRPGVAVVTQGFIGADREGRTTLLGRGGSDYSASLLGAALGAERIEIWTDVDGVLTANPRLVPTARRGRVLSFDEASELAYFGAKVLHPSTLLPAMEASIPVWVGNSRRPGGDGTTIVASGADPSDDRVAVKAIAEKRGITVVHVASTRMLMAHGFHFGLDLSRS